MDNQAWWATVHVVSESDMTERLTGAVTMANSTLGIPD